MLHGYNTDALSCDCILVWEKDGGRGERGWAVVCARSRVWSGDQGLYVCTVSPSLTCLNFGPIKLLAASQKLLSFMIHRICLLKLCPMRISARQLAAVMRDQPVLPRLL